MDYPVVDLTESAEGATPVGPSGQAIAPSWSVNGAEVAAAIEDLRSELSSRISSDEESGLRLSELILKLTVTAEGKLAFVAKGSVEASIEAKFKW